MEKIKFIYSRGETAQSYSGNSRSFNEIIQIKEGILVFGIENIVLTTYLVTNLNLNPVNIQVAGVLDFSGIARVNNNNIFNPGGLGFQNTHSIIFGEGQTFYNNADYTVVDSTGNIIHSCSWIVLQPFGVDSSNNFVFDAQTFIITWKLRVEGWYSYFK